MFEILLEEYQWRWRLASVSEAPIVHRIMLESFEEYRGALTPPSGALSESVEDVTIAMKQGGAILALVDGNPVGSSRYKLCDGYSYIGRISVLPAYRNRGIGRHMVRFSEELTRDLGLFVAQLEVRLSIPSNVSYYTKLGYQVTSLHHYPNKTDSWYTMSKRLEP